MTQPNFTLYFASDSNYGTLELRSNKTKLTITLDAEQKESIRQLITTIWNEQAPEERVADLKFAELADWSELDDPSETPF